MRCVASRAFDTSSLRCVQEVHGLTMVARDDATRPLSMYIYIIVKRLVAAQRDSVNERWSSQLAHHR